MNRIFAKVFLLLLLPQALLGSNFWTPRIHNHGAYKASAVRDNIRPLYGHVPKEIHAATRLSAMDVNSELSLSVVLPLNNESELDILLQDMVNQTNIAHRKFLSQEDFLARYAPTKDQVRAVTTYLKAQGITTTSVAKNRLILRVAGSVGAINRVFHTELTYFAHEDGCQFYAPSYELQVDHDLAIHSVHGLENLFKATPKLASRSTTQITGVADDIAGLTPSAIKAAYSLTSSWDGTGQTAALFELDGFNFSDILAYQNQFNLPNIPINVVLVDDATGLPGANAVQVVTDIELTMALAPGLSQIIVYQGPNTASGVLDTYNRIASDNVAKSISTSWGASELTTPGSLISAEALVFKQMAAQGQSLFAATGNHGAYDDGINLSVEDPASQPLAVAVSGTTLSTNGDGTYNSETTWFNSEGNQGGNGGISTIWTATSWQQPLANGGGASNNFRNVPDVALNADPNTGYAIYANGQWGVYGGTGAASALWASLTALINQSLASNGQSTVGLLSPFLYQIALDPNYESIFRDISDNSTNGYYPAITGYDLATGLGSVMADQLIFYVTTETPPSNTCIAANPSVIALPLIQVAQAGGPLTYSVYIANLDSGPCGVSTFNLSALMPTGFTVSFSNDSVTLQPEQSAIVTATIASNLDADAYPYSFSITATNDNNASYTADASGVYQVLGNRGQGINLTISPVNGGIFYPSADGFAMFQIILTNGQEGIPNQSTTLTVLGPDYFYQDTPSTGNDGSYLYNILVNQGVALGTYTVTVTATYQGTQVTASISFSVDLPFP